MTRTRIFVLAVTGYAVLAGLALLARFVMT